MIEIVVETMSDSVLGSSDATTIGSKAEGDTSVVPDVVTEEDTVIPSGVTFGSGSGVVILDTELRYVSDTVSGIEVVDGTAFCEVGVDNELGPELDNKIESNCRSA